MTCIPGSCGPECIAFKHSFGPDNCDPCLDLGGPISACDISDDIDNLFHSIGPNLSRKGHEDYRCFYIQNMHPTDTLRNLIAYFEGTGSQVPGKRGGTYAALGVTFRSEIQEILVSGSPGIKPNEGEFFELLVPGYSPTFKVFYDPNITKWVGNFQIAIRAVTGLPEVGVTVNDTDVIPNVTFTINYGGYDTRNSGEKGTQNHYRLMQARNHQIDLIQIINNTLSNVIVNALPVQDGSPVNTIAELIPDEITPPTGIVFDYYLRGNPMRVGDLRPGEYFPIWLRRTLPFPDLPYGNLAKPGQMAKLLDDFKIRVNATYP